MAGAKTSIAERQENKAQRTLEQPTFLRLPPYEAVGAFCELFGDELAYRTAHNLDARDLRRYYQNLFLADGTPSLLGVYGYASRLVPGLSSLREAGSTVRLLDAGCGYGTESLLFALSGAQVTGVELVAERVELARSRLGFYQGQVSAPFSIQFVNADVIHYLEKADAFDIVWIMEAVSHIHPLETFLPLVHKSLSLGGLLITSDPNALNPVALYRACRIRGTPHHRLREKARNPASGEPVYEAVERIFSVRDYARRLSETGFQVTQIVMSGFLASSLVSPWLHRNRLAFALLTSFQKVLQRLPVVQLMGANYTIVAKKVAGGDAAREREGAQACGS